MMRYYLKQRILHPLKLRIIKMKYLKDDPESNSEIRITIKLTAHIELTHVNFWTHVNNQSNQSGNSLTSLQSNRNSKQ